MMDARVARIGHPAGMTDTGGYDDQRRGSIGDPRLSIAEPFTFLEARRHGLSPAQLRTMVRTGLLRRVFTGVYVDSVTPDTQLTRTQALGKILPPTAVVTDESAGWVHMIDLDPPSAQVIAPPVTVFQKDGATRVRKAGTHGGQRHLLDRDVVVINGVRVTSPLRTALDLGRLRPRDRAMASLDALLRTRLFTHEELLGDLVRFKGMRGVVQLRELAPLADPRAQSPPESIIRLRCLDYGLPRLVPQVEVRREMTGERAFLDLASETLRFAVEFDGRAWHERDHDVRRDRSRRAWLAEEAGWHIMVLTGTDVYGVARDHTANVVRRRLEAHVRRLR